MSLLADIEAVKKVAEQRGNNLSQDDAIDFYDELASQFESMADAIREDRGELEYS